ncbi:MAG: hypothetical protein AB8F34_04320 [Akkermansiaceae bacterium]
MLSLSTTTIRADRQSSAHAEAQANARLALMLAIGELQKSMGPDQRISANGEILSDPTNSSSTVKNPNWTGVWHSWRADSDPAGNDEQSQHSTINDADTGIHPSYEADRKDHFLSWLVSLDAMSAEEVDSARNLDLAGQYVPAPNDDAVILVGQGSLGNNPKPEKMIQAPLVSARLKSDSSGTRLSGRYGWWIGDESQKVNVMDDSYESYQGLGIAERLFRQQAPASVGKSTIDGLDSIKDETQLSSLPSRKTLPFVDGVTNAVTSQYHDITTTSYGILSDVREGGLKRDLSTILERTIDPEEVYNLTLRPDTEFQWASSLKGEGKDFLLYSFDNMVNSVVGNTTAQASVPIQDLASYYQLYNSYRPDSAGGIQYSSSDSSPSNSHLPSGIMVSNPDYGETRSDYDNYLRQHSALYRNPVPVKIEMVLSYVTEPIFPVPTDPNEDKYRLRIGVSPAITLWNPNNVPMVLNTGNPDRASIMIRETPIPLKVTFKKSETRDGPPTQTHVRDFRFVTSGQQGELYTLFISGNYPAVFQPGESKVFALQYASGTDGNAASNSVDFGLRGRIGGRYAEQFVPELELVPGWNPEKFIRPSTRQGGRRGGEETVFTFDDNDFISAAISGGTYNTFTVDFAQKSRHGRNAPGVMWHYRSFSIKSRLNRSNNGGQYRNDFVYQGFPNGGNNISDRNPREILIPARSAEKLITAMQTPFNPRDDLPQSFFYYSIKAATETHESQNVAPILGGSGRRFPSRPFTHSTAMAPAILDSVEPNALYNYGWNWFFMPLDNLLDAPISIANGDHGYYGGGFTAENGTTHNVQQHLPLTPPISIASLSHAHLGGFSLATEAAAPGYWGLRDPWNRASFQRVTAIGYAGLAPHTLQAIGNSYAHPNIPKDKALHTWDRYYTDQGGGPRNTVEPFADHSYLANKALWDEFFFSSITPKPESVKVFSEEATAQDAARKFFFDQEALPNPRILPYSSSLDEDQLDQLLTNYDKYKDGFADKISSHLMVEGPFNINSTSITAWRALFSSLKGKQVSYLDKDFSIAGGVFLDNVKPDGVPLAAGALPNGKAYTGSSSEPSDDEQWIGWRELTDKEISELAEAMVEQVKLRGPFLSLSEFINRRLDNDETDLSLKGALQAAIDDPDVSINEGFRDDRRKFTNRETSFVGAEFPEAMEGPVAYGSSAYVDQADILRSFPAQLTPRGDTFVIRTYGDSIDANGKIQARAWCEAVVQRTPDYLDPADEPQLKQSLLTSESNKKFGRKFTIVKFSWLNASEI